MSPERAIEPDLPLAFLVGYDRPTQPRHPDPLAQRGLTGYREGTGPGGTLRHTSHQVSYDAHRTTAHIYRPGTSREAEPQAALAMAMYAIAISEHKPLSEAVNLLQHEMDKAAHDYQPAILAVDGIGYDGWELREHGVTARAAVVNGGWTVVAVVPEGQEPAVELEHIEATAMAA